MKSYIWIPLSILGISSIKAQQKIQQLVCPAASQATLITASGDQFSWSIGELATLTVGAGSSNLIATQGQQQPFIQAVPMIELPEMIPTVNNGLTVNDMNGQNDFFKIANIDSFPDNRLIIVNRWGETIYQKEESYKNDWRGQDVNGDYVETGTYYYVFEDLRRKKAFKGYILVINPQ